MNMRILIASAHLAEQGTEQAGERTGHTGLETWVLRQQRRQQSARSAVRQAEMKWMCAIGASPSSSVALRIEPGDVGTY